MKTKRQDVVVIGSGCAGAWLVHELSYRGFSCALVDTVPFAAYTSTRNQGWLQSGAFYLSIEKR